MSFRSLLSWLAIIGAQVAVLSGRAFARFGLLFKIKPIMLCRDNRVTCKLARFHVIHIEANRKPKAGVRCYERYTYVVRLAIVYGQSEMFPIIPNTYLVLRRPIIRLINVCTIPLARILFGYLVLARMDYFECFSIQLDSFHCFPFSHGLPSSAPKLPS